jgi:hypothetical protein
MLCRNRSFRNDFVCPHMAASDPAAPMKTRRWPVEPAGILVRAISPSISACRTGKRPTKTRRLPAGFFSIDQ